MNNSFPTRREKSLISSRVSDTLYMMMMMMMIIIFIIIIIIISIIIIMIIETLIRVKNYQPFTYQEELQYKAGFNLNKEINKCERNSQTHRQLI